MDTSCAWPEVSFGDIFDIASSKRVLQRQWKRHGVPFYRAREIVKLAQHGRVANELFISEELYDELAKKYGVPKPGDLMVSAVGTLGACYQVQPGDRFYFKDASVLCFHPKTEVCSGFFEHAFLTRAIRNQIASGSGSTVGTLTISRANSLRIPLPPLDEQRRIAAILDKADELRRKRKRALDLLERLSGSIFMEMFGDPVSNPKRLTHVRLGDVIHKASDGPHVSPIYAESGIPFLSTRHVHKGRILWEDLKFIDREQAEVHWKKCRPERGDILYTKGGTTGLAAAVETDDPFAVWVHVALLKLDRDRVEPLWLESMLNSDYCYRQSQRYTHGIANRDLGLKRMTKIEMYLPTKSEQRRFVDASQHVRKIKSKMMQAAVGADLFFSSLQSRAFSGQL